MAPNVASSWSISGKEGLLVVSLALSEWELSGEIFNKAPRFHVLVTSTCI
jgi:hypothetical protein